MKPRQKKAFYLFFCLSLTVNVPAMAMYTTPLQKWLQGDQQSRPNRIYVKFIGVAAAEAKSRDKIHKKIGSTKLIYRSKHMPVDLLTAKGEGNVTSLAKLRKICDVYVKQKVVQFCEPDDWAVKGSKESNCDPVDAELKEVNRFTAHINQIDKAIKIKNCEVVPVHGHTLLINKQLSPFWAQELVGSDLAVQALLPIKEELSPVKYGDLEPFDSNSVPHERVDGELLNSIKKGEEKYINDYGSEDLDETSAHGTLANNLIIAPFPVGTSINATYTVANSSYSSNANRAALGDKMIEKKVSLFGTSLLGTTEMDEVLFKKLREKKVVMVMAAGNDYPQTQEQKLTEDAIVVGSISPTGLMSFFSSESKDVTISAPSDGHVTSSFKGSFKDFSGTSGARPIVTGAIANVMALLPGISQDEIRELLIKTAVRTVDANNLSGGNGAGMLNSYKLTRVSLRLREKWPENRERIFKDDQVYDFKTESLSEAAEAKKYLKQTDLCKKKEGLKKLRKAFLLDPENKEHADNLAKAYRSQGLHLNAMFYDSLKGVDQGFLEKAMEIDDPWVKAAALRKAPELGVSAWTQVKNSLRSKDDRELYAAVVAADKMNKKEEALAALVEAFRIPKENFAEQMHWLHMAKKLGYKTTDFSKYCSQFSLAYYRDVCSVHSRK